MAPVLLLLTFTVIQGAYWYHARTVALAAATQGTEHSRALGGTRADGAEAAAGFINRVGGDSVLRAVHVTATRTATQATVTVTGHSVSLIPGVAGPTITQTASGPVERFTTADTP